MSDQKEIICDSGIQSIHRIGAIILLWQCKYIMQYGGGYTTVNLQEKNSCTYKRSHEVRWLGLR